MSFLFHFSMKEKHRNNVFPSPRGMVHRWATVFRFVTKESWLLLAVGVTGVWPGHLREVKCLRLSLQTLHITTAVVWRLPLLRDSLLAPSSCLPRLVAHRTSAWKPKITGVGEIVSKLSISFYLESEWSRQRSRGQPELPESINEQLFSVRLFFRHL